MCLKKSEYAHCIDLPAEDERVRKYLKGETLELADMTLPISKGWWPGVRGRASLRLGQGLPEEP